MVSEIATQLSSASRLASRSVRWPGSRASRSSPPPARGRGAIVIAGRRPPEAAA